MIISRFFLLLISVAGFTFPSFCCEKNLTDTLRNANFVEEVFIEEEETELIFDETPEGLISVDENLVLKDTDITDNKNIEQFSFKPKQLILPLSLIAVGTIGYYWKGFHHLNEKVKDGMAHIRGDHYLHFDDWIQYVPAAAYLGLGFYKEKRKLDFRERIAVGVTAYLSMTAIVNIAKVSFKEKRPDTSSRNSFPSGHTATAFTGAELIRAEFGWGIGSAAYIVSSGVAFLRLYNNRHWLNDVIAGAGIGILSARIGYWMLPLYRKWFHWEKKENKSCLITVPSYSGDGPALNLMYLF